ncbi:protein phosphatase CheZ [Vibrio parahaemolyticus]
MISLEQAKSLVQMLENGEQDQANMLVASLYEGTENPVLQEIGTLTRDLHDSLKQFNLDQRMTEIAKDEIPNARDRLHYVIEKTELAANKTSTELRGQLTEILMAQDFQDLTGQIIRRVITLVNEVEGRLVEILTVFSGQKPAEQVQVLSEPADKKIKQSSEAEGPILHPELREDAVSSQDEVDDLLSSLGF